MLLLQTGAESCGAITRSYKILWNLSPDHIQLCENLIYFSFLHFYNFDTFIILDEVRIWVSFCYWRSFYEFCWDSLGWYSCFNNTLSAHGDVETRKAHCEIGL